MCVRSHAGGIGLYIFFITFTPTVWRNHSIQWAMWEEGGRNLFNCLVTGATSVTGLITMGEGKIDHGY